MDENGDLSEMALPPQVGGQVTGLISCPVPDRRLYTMEGYYR